MRSQEEEVEAVGASAQVLCCASPHFLAPATLSSAGSLGEEGRPRRVCYPSRGQLRVSHTTLKNPPWVIPPFSTFRIVILSSFVFEEYEVSGALLASHLNI